MLLTLLRRVARRPIYLARLASAATQLIVVFSLGSVSHSLLGTYSIYTAALAVLFQVVQFEGAYLAIGGALAPDHLRRIHRSTNLLWTSALAVLIVSLAHTPLALLFSLAFALNLSAEWAVNLWTIDDRISRRDDEFQRLMLGKILAVDTFLPLLLCALMFYDVESTRIYIACGALIAAHCYLLGRLVGYPLRIREFALPNWHLVYGVAVKRIDGTFIRLFTGATLGATVLGGVQLVLSISRVLNMLTPTWLSMNVGKIVDQSRSGTDGLKVTIRYMMATYVAYITFAVLLYAASSFVTALKSDVIIVFLVVMFFGNQNTKAFLRQQDLVSGRVRNSNLAVTVGLFGKCGLALALLPYGLHGILAAVFMIDVLTIALMIFFFRRSLEA